MIADPLRLECKLQGNLKLQRLILSDINLDTKMDVL